MVMMSLLAVAVIDLSIVLFLLCAQRFCTPTPEPNPTPAETNEVLEVYEILQMYGEQPE